MDSTEAATTVLSRIQKIDPDNACKIMGYLLLQDAGEKEMIRLAFGPENQLISLINQAKSCLGLSAKSCLGLSPNTSSSSPFIPISRPNSFPQSSPRLIIPNNGFHMTPSSPWFPNPSHMSPKPDSPLSYAAVVNGGSESNSPHPFPSPSNPSPFYPNEDYIPGQDEHLFLEDGKNLDFTDPIMSPGGRGDSMLFPFGNCNENHHHLLHRSVSVNDVFLGGGGQLDENVPGGLGWKPCMYFAKGFCKNGGGCKFVHGDCVDSPDGSLNFDGFDEMMRIKAIQQQQRLGMAAGAPLPFNSRCMSFLNENPRSAAAAMMGEDFHTFGRCRHERNDFGAFGFGGNNSSSLQIYLTFPADSTFKEEDVSNYFSAFGPVQDVRIPYQQKRMFGFVTFVYPETVKQILAKGNPHFVCDSRVLVKPYKEKGKIADKKCQMEMAEFPACLSPSGPDARDPYDLPFGGRMLYNRQELMFRRKLEEQAELQQAIEYQGRRLMNLQLPDMMNHNLNHQFQRHHLAAFPIPSAAAYAQINQNLAHSSNDTTEEVLEGSNGGKDEDISPTIAADPLGNEHSNANNGNDSDNDQQNVPNLGDSGPHGSVEHNLPDNFFASPTKPDQSLSYSASDDIGDSVPVTSTSSSNPAPAVTSAPNMASCFFEMPRC